MQLIQLSDQCFVAGQPSPEDMASLAEQGFQHIVCNRPDGESPGQPTMEVMAAAAAAAGMTFMRYPVDATNFPGDDLTALGQLFDGGDRVLAYCRTGTRCANLWVMTRGDDAVMDAFRLAQGIGFDLSLVQLHRR